MIFLCIIVKMSLITGNFVIISDYDVNVNVNFNGKNYAEIKYFTSHFVFINVHLSFTNSIFDEEISEYCFAVPETFTPDVFRERLDTCFQDIESEDATKEILRNFVLSIITPLKSKSARK